MTMLLIKHKPIGWELDVLVTFVLSVVFKRLPYLI